MYTQEFVHLVMGDRSIYPIPFDKNGEDNIAVEVEAKQLLHHGYVISNLMDLRTLTPDQIADFCLSFQPDIKSGYILRKGFANSPEFKDYSEEEWRVIFAQYSLTYGWSSKFRHLYDESPVSVISDYNDEEISNIKQIMEDSKVIKIGFRKDTVALIKDILESSVVLRTHQKKILETCPDDVFIDAFHKANITIRETFISAVMRVKENHKVSNVFKSPTDVLRFILAKFAHDPFEGQITKPDLKDRHVRIPTSYRKWLVKELDEMHSGKVICEDMFKYESYWKLMHKYLRFGKSKIARQRFPIYHEAIDLLFNGDRSWTFNGRYSAAIAIGNYTVALTVASERPGFLLRNILNFLRYPKGTRIAQTSDNKVASLNPAVKLDSKLVFSDNIKYFFSTDFAFLMANRSNTKLAFQLIEQLKNPAIYVDQSQRIVQGITKHYSIPIPGIKKETANKVIEAVKSGIKLQLQRRNKNVGKVYIDETLKNSMLQYSGRNSTELNYSGTFLTPGSKLDIPDTPILRLGVIWRGSRSTDIDHNVSLFNGFDKIADVYFGRPVYENIVDSSGDIVTCNRTDFSAEFIDIDMDELRKDTDITSLITSLISYTGTPIGDTECYLFIKSIGKDERVVYGRAFKIDLMDTDYAVRLDAEGIEKSISYIGFNILVDENKIQVCAYTPKDAGEYSTIARKGFTPSYLEGIFGNQTDLYETLHMAFQESQFVHNDVDADLVFGPTGLDPATDLEKINNYIL